MKRSASDINQSLMGNYCLSLQKDISHGDATEHTYRSSLKTLLEALLPGCTATNEPKKKSNAGKPDIVLWHKETRVGYLETKDLDADLDKVEQSEQGQRYLRALQNLVITNYREFRWYVQGSLKKRVCIAKQLKRNRLQFDTNAYDGLTSLLLSFYESPIIPISTPKELASRMAWGAHLVQEHILAAFKEEANSGPLHIHFKAFQKMLLPTLDAIEFSDMYAQTIAYGLFAARCAVADGTTFSRQIARDAIPKTNPFLRKMFDRMAGVDLPDSVAWIVDEMTRALTACDMQAIRNSFLKNLGQGDPVVYFYEDFLSAYDPELREKRGVYYTPLPVVNFIVKSVDQTLRRNLGRKEGLADPKVLILDPAVGTGSFLYSTINQIHHLTAKNGRKGAWESIVREELISRIFGFEILMAPYTVAHLKIELLLEDLGYHFKSQERLGIFLTNTLEEAALKSDELIEAFIAEESEAASRIKTQEPIMVVLGNPPYAGHSSNNGAWISKLIEDYKSVNGQRLKERNLKWLNDDYVKFIRFGQSRIENTGQGVLAFITNHGYMDNSTFRGMRASLLNTFDELYFLDLHGNVKKQEQSPDGSVDQNVFDIQQGVAICILVKHTAKLASPKVYHADLWGSREEKYHFLSTKAFTDINWAEVHPQAPESFFLPQDDTLKAEYEQGWSVKDIFVTSSSGIVTARDSLTINFDKENALATAKDFVSCDPEVARTKYRLGKDARDWRVSWAQKDLRESGIAPRKVIPILYRPFDTRYTVYTGHSRGFHCMPRGETMHHMIAGRNIGLVTVRKIPPRKPANYFCATRDPISNGSIRSDNQSIDCLFPLYLYPNDDDLPNMQKRSNFSVAFENHLKQRLGCLPIPEDIFGYLYAVVHSRVYRTRYVQFLGHDFPRIPITRNKRLFKVLAKKGWAMASAHLLETPFSVRRSSKFHHLGNCIVESPYHDGKRDRLYINDKQFFSGVTEDAWNFHIGPYQVCSKWLAERKSMRLSSADIRHFQKVIACIYESYRLFGSIEITIRKAGGWPRAFEVLPIRQRRAEIPHIRRAA